MGFSPKGDDMSKMVIYMNKQSVCSILGDQEVSLKNFAGIDYAKDGVVISSARTLFLGRIRFTIMWPNGLNEYRKNREGVETAIGEMLAYCDRRYAAASAAAKKVVAATSVAATT